MGDRYSRSICRKPEISGKSFNIKEKPTNAEDDMFQVRHYANKLSGKLYYGTFNDFFKDYRKIRSINKEILQSEGEIIF